MPCTPTTSQIQDPKPTVLTFFDPTFDPNLTLSLVLFVFNAKMVRYKFSIIEPIFKMILETLVIVLLVVFISNNRLSIGI